MIGGPAIGAFLLWILYGLWLRKGSERLRTRLESWPRKKRIVTGPMYLLGSVTLLFLTLVGLEQTGGLTRDGLTWWGWVVVTIVGLGFVYLQVTAAAMMITLAHVRETPKASPTSMQASDEVLK